MITPRISLRGFAVMLSLAGSVVLALFIVNADAFFTPVLLVLSVFAFIALLFWIVSKRSRPLDFFEPIWALMFGAVTILIYPVTMYITGSFDLAFVRLNPELSKAVVAKATALIVIGYYFATLGYFTNFGKTLAYKLPCVSDTFNRRRATWVVVLFLVVSISAFLIFQQEVGLGIPELINRTYTRAVFSSGQGYLKLLVQLIVLPCTLLVVLLRNPRRSPVFWFVLVLATVMLTLFGSRTNVIFWVWIPVLIVYHYYQKPLRFSGLVSIAAIILVFSAVVLRARMLSSQNMAVSLDEVTSSIEVGTVVNSAFTDRSTFFDVLVWVVDAVPESASPWYGRTYLNLLVAPIPRSIWPEKPVGFTEGNIITQMMFGEELGRYHGTPPDLIGLFYMHFLFPGVVLGMFFVGIVHRAVYELLLRQKNNVGMILLYPILWNGAPLFFSVIGLTQILPMLAIYIPLVMFMTHGTAKRKAYAANGSMLAR